MYHPPLLVTLSHTNSTLRNLVQNRATIEPILMLYFSDPCSDQALNLWEHFLSYFRPNNRYLARLRPGQKEILRFDLQDDSKNRFKIPNLPFLGAKKASMVNYLFLSENVIFFTGELKKQAGTKDWYTYNFITQELVTRDEFRQARFGHGLCAASGHIHAFGGYFRDELLQSSERCPIYSGSWTNLPPLPVPLNWVQTELYQGIIFIAGINSNRVIAFDASSLQYQLCDFDMRCNDKVRIICSTPSMMYMISAGENVVQVEPSLRWSWHKGIADSVVPTAISGWVDGSFYYMTISGDIMEFEAETRSLKRYTRI